MTKSLIPISLVALVWASVPAHAVVINDHSNGSTAPIPAPSGYPVDNVGYVNNGAFPSAIYLGNDWFLAAAHAFGAQNNVLLDGVWYTWDQSVPWGALVDGNGLQLDTRLFKVVESVHVNAAPIASGPIMGGENIVMAGTGFTGQYSDNATPGNVFDDYFNWAGTRSAAPGSHWGTNVIDSIGSGISGETFVTDFDNPLDSESTAYEANTTNGDSGAAAYVLENGQLSLAGLAISRSGVFGTTRYGDTTTWLDLTEYRDQILTITGVIPEPSGATLLAIAGTLLLGRRRR